MHTHVQIRTPIPDAPFATNKRRDVRHHHSLRSQLIAALVGNLGGNISPTSVLAGLFVFKK